MEEKRVELQHGPADPSFVGMTATSNSLQQPSTNVQS
jgi:hypothetical protein